MKLRKYIFTTLLLSIGLIMHQITPGFLGGMKFDFLLIFMFLSLFINRERDNFIITALLAGLLSALTTTFPGGQLPNMIDKAVTCMVLFILLKSLGKFEINSFIVGLTAAVGTFVSGMTFLSVASFISGLPVPMKALVVGVVLPATLLNIIGTIFIFKVVKVALKNTRAAF